MEEMEEAAVVIQGSFRCHAARKMTMVMKEEKKKRDQLKKTAGPSLDEDMSRLFGDD